MAIVTLSRQIGSGGDEIAAALLNAALKELPKNPNADVSERLKTAVAMLQLLYQTPSVKKLVTAFGTQEVLSWVERV